MPVTGVKDTVPEKGPPAEVDNSYPVGAVIEISPNKLSPEIIMDCALETVPAQPVKELNEPLVLMVGIAFEQLKLTPPEAFSDAGAAASIKAVELEGSPIEPPVL